MPGSELSSTPTDYAISLIAPTSLPNSVSNQHLENETMYHLIRNNAVQNIMSNVTGIGYTNLDTSYNCTAHTYDNNEMLACDISTSSGLHDGSIVVSTYHNQFFVTNNDVQELNFGTADCSHNKLFTIDEPSSSIYDSHIQITSEPNNGPFGLENPLTSFEATFRNGGSNQEMQKNINSKYGNTNGIQNLYVIEETTFNTTNALGKAQNKYFTLDASYGTRNAAALPLLNDISSNNIDVVMTNLTDISINHCGTYRIQQHPDHANVEVYNTNGLIISDSSVNQIPIHTTNNISVSNTLNRLPIDDIAPLQFRSMFNRNTDIILPEYKFEVNVTRNIDNKSGIGFNTDTNIKSNALITLDDSNLVENPYFIKEWADKLGTLTFSPATVTLINSTNGDTLNITKNLISLDTGREGLNVDDHNNNGTIFIQKFDPFNRTTILSEDGSLNESLLPAIYYENEYPNYISDENKVNHYIEYTAQMVFKSPIDDNIKFISDNTSALNLIARINDVPTVVNANFDPLDWSMTSSNGVDNLNEVWKIVAQSRLNSYESLRNSLGNKVDNICTSAFIQNIKTPIEIGAINAKANITIKPVLDLTFCTDFSANGWSLSSSATNGLLESASNVAFAPDVSSYFPMPYQMVDLISGLVTSIPFTVEFNPGNLDANGHVKSDLVSDFCDNVKITWGTPGNLNILQIPQEKLNRTDLYIAVNNTIIPSSDYTLTNELSGRNIILTQYTSTKRYKINFDMGLRPFSTLVATSPLYEITSNYYIARDMYSGDILPVANLSLITSKNAIPIDFTKIDEFITSHTSLSVTSTITNNDVKEFNVKIIMMNGNNIWSDISEQICVSSFYAKNPTIFNLLPAFDSRINDSDISLLLQYQYMNTSAEEKIVTFNDHTGYYINFKNDYKNNFSLSSWSSQVNLIGDNSSSSIGYNSLIGDNTEYISPSNGFSSLDNNTWNISNYSLNISYTGVNESQTVLTIVRNSDNTNMHIITLSNNKAITVPIYISRSNRFDTWRIIKKVGFNLQNLTNSSERFMSTKYIDASGNTNRFQIEDGVHLKKDILNLDTVQTPGKSIKFKLLSDNVQISLVTDIATTTQGLLSPITWNSASDTGLIFQFLGNYGSFSKTLTLRNYRGYIGADTIIQRYIIQRQITTMTIKWTNNSPGSGRPSFYKQENLVSYSNTVATNNQKYVNNINPYDATGVIIASETQFTDLGLQLIPNFSMLADSDIRNYDLHTKGDSIIITIVNPNNSITPSYPVINTSLKQYLIYSFSGSNYNNTNENLQLFSSKLKINENMKYSITLIQRRMSIYKDNNYLGNPVLKGQMDPLVNTPPTNWGTEIISGTYTETLVGLTMPGYNIRRRPNTNYDESISFLVLHPPMQRFNIMPYSCPGSIPIANMIDTTPITKADSLVLIKDKMRLTYKKSVDDLLTILQSKSQLLTSAGETFRISLSNLQTGLWNSSRMNVESSSTYDLAIIKTNELQIITLQIHTDTNSIIQSPNINFKDHTSINSTKFISSISAQLLVIQNEYNTLNSMISRGNYGDGTGTNSITSKQFCLPVVDKLPGDSGPKYEPFKSSISFTHINGDIVTVTNDNSKINDVVFYHKEPRVASAFVNSPLNTVFKFNITGSLIKIDLYMGLKAEPTSRSTLNIYTGFASGLLLLDASASYSNTLLKLSGPKSYGTGAQVSFLQSGISPYIIPSNTIFGINNSTNISFTVPNFFLGQVTNPIKLDLPTGPGTVINLYTRTIIKDDNNGQPKVVLYKYIPTSTAVDWNNYTLLERSIINCSFSSREKKTFTLPHRVLEQQHIQTFDELLNLIPKSEIVNSSWVNDASFNAQNIEVRFTFSSLNFDCIESTLPKFMSPPNNLGYGKFNVVTRTKALKITDKCGFPLADIDHDGITRVTTVSTGCVLLNNIIDDTLTSYDALMKRPVITFSKGKYM